jgi:uncharacterized protein (TIGR02246 family)
MTRQFALVGFLGVVLLTAGCNQAPAPVAAVPDTREADKKAIGDMEIAWNTDREAKDAARLLAHYADDATLMEPGSPPLHGKQAIGKVLNDMVADKALSQKFRPSRIEVAASGDIAYAQGTYEITMTSPVTKKPTHDKGSYVTVYRKVDGAWKVVSDIATSEAMPAPSK